MNELMRASKREIERILNQAEIEKNLEKDVLARIYEAEARVVYMRRRGSILKDLRNIIVEAAENHGRH